MTLRKRWTTPTHGRCHGAIALLVGAPIIFLAVGLGGALAIFFQNSLLTSGGMGVILPILTLDNYLSLFDEFFASVMVNTLLISLTVVGLTVLIGYPAAIYIARHRSWLARTVFLIVLASSAMSLVVRALGCDRYAHRRWSGQSGPACARSGLPTNRFL